MNDKFFSLPEEKQQRIINAGYHVFSKNSYKKSPVGEIALTAGISKSLLFHYFHNKKELYLFLWNKAAEITLETVKSYACYETEDLFEMMRRGMYAKLAVMKKYPDLTAFTLKAFYENEPEIVFEIQKSYANIVQSSAAIFMPKLNPADFRPGLELEMIIKTMYWTTEGYLWKVLQLDSFDFDQLEKDFLKILDFWKIAYCRDIQEESTSFCHEKPVKGDAK